MRITYICYEDLTEGRGGVGHVVEVIRALTRQGHTIRLIVPAGRGEAMPDLSGVEIVTLRVGRIRILNWILFYKLSALYLLLTRRPDVVYIREMVYNIFLPKAMFLLRRSLFVEVNALVQDEEALVGAGAMTQRLIRWSQAVTFRCSHTIVAVTRGIADQLIRMYRIPEHRAHVVPNGTDPELFKPGDMTDARKAIEVDADRPVVGFVGACYPYHDVLTLIAAAPEILEKQPETLFLIVGDGYMRTRWIEETADKGLSDAFRFTGQVPYKQVPDYMNAFTVCTAPFTRTRNEKIGLSPMKLYDYLACGRPVVGSEIAGVGDFLEQSGGGLSVIPEDPTAFADAVVHMLDHPEEREQMGYNGREYVLTHNTWTQTAAKIAVLCEKAMGETG